MAARISYAEEFQDAFTIAKRVQTSAGGFRTFRRHWPELDLDTAHEIWDKTWPRARRVKYFTEAPAGSFTSKEKLGCGPSGNSLFVVFQTFFTDDSGDMHEQYIQATVDIEKRIGMTREAALEQVMKVIRDRYFRGWMLPDVNKQIQGYNVTQVKCLSGGSR